MRIKFHLSRRTGIVLGSVGLTAALGLAAAAVVYVNAARLDIVDKKGAVSNTVATVERNASLNVVAKEGKWYKVEYQGKQGYVFENAVADAPGKAKNDISLASVKGGTIPQLENAAAVKGVDEGARQYASGSGLRTTGLEEMIRRRSTITPREFEQFIATGGLPGAAAQAAPEQRDALANAASGAAAAAKN